MLSGRRSVLRLAVLFAGGNSGAGTLDCRTLRRNRRRLEAGGSARPSGHRLLAVAAATPAAVDDDRHRSIFRDVRGAEPGHGHLRRRCARTRSAATGTQVRATGATCELLRVRRARLDDEPDGRGDRVLG
ncbi:hypothetical protein AURDEDRAFT_117254 [Auricularia subglabra TFB-10046 SS5]|nr:hypothetical protein AURDEDRAFT_117254 [Auricularia subglabra TFB-10046 SS5]